MSQVEIFSFLDKYSYDIAFFCTYNFDPVFFEKRLLRSKGLCKSRRIMIFMDAHQYQQLLASNLSLNAINHRYLVVPVYAPSGVFHSKLCVFLNEIGGQILCGSGNLTQMGYTHNLELVNKIPIVADHENGIYGNINLLTSSISFYNQLLSKLDDQHAIIAKKWIDELHLFIPWFHGLDDLPATEGSPKLITSMSGDIWSKINKELAGKRVSKIEILSPFFDKTLYMLGEISKKFPKTKIDLISQQNTGNLNPSQIKKRGKNVDLYELLVKENRRLHAKLFSFRLRQKSLIITGSANLSRAALLNGNIETCLLYYLPSKRIDDLFKKDITKKKIAPTNFEPGKEAPPEPVEEDTNELQLYICTQTSEDSINIIYSVNCDCEIANLSLEIMNSFQMKPLCSIHVPYVNRVEKKNRTLKINANVTSQFQGTVLCRLTAKMKGKKTSSNPSWLIQESCLTYTPSDYDPYTANEKEIRETGSGLIEVLDVRIKEDGIVNTIEYLNNLNIRFKGEKGRGKAVRNILKYRNPYQDEQETDWTIFYQNDADGLKEALCDFVDRHQNKVLHRHASTGNINGLSNFIDVFETCNRLLYVYGKRGVIPKPWVVGKITENIVIFTSGKESRNEVYDGFLEVIYCNYEGDQELVNGELQAMKVFDHLYSALIISQMVRREYHENPNIDLNALLPTEKKQINEMLDYSGLKKPSSKEIIELLEEQNYVDNENNNWQEAIARSY